MQVERTLRRGLLASSALLCLALAILYAGQWDGAAAVTIVPPWLWAVPAGLLVLTGWSPPNRRFALIVMGGWLLFLALSTEEPRSLVRGWCSASSEDPADGKHGCRIRIVSLNCAGSQIAAARETKAYHADVVLLQESPRREEVENLARELFSEHPGCLPGLDTSIIVRGTIHPAVRSERRHLFFTEARVRLFNGEELEVFCVRLSTPAVRIDFWKRGCWQEQQAIRLERKQQLREILQRVRALPAGCPVLIGGDFNAPHGDATFRLMPANFHDAFGGAGIGWCNTIINEMPFSRIDQIWIDQHFEALSLAARRTQHSDHRMVICDVRLAR